MDLYIHRTTNTPTPPPRHTSQIPEQEKLPRTFHYYDQLLLETSRKDLVHEPTKSPHQSSCQGYLSVFYNSSLSWRLAFSSFDFRFNLRDRENHQLKKNNNKNKSCGDGQSHCVTSMSLQEFSFFLMKNNGQSSNSHRVMKFPAKWRS